MLLVRRVPPVFRDTCVYLSVSTCRGDLPSASSITSPPITVEDLVILTRIDRTELESARWCANNLSKRRCDGKGKMDANLKIGFLILWASVTLLPLAVSSTKELLDCRANLSAAIRNDSTFVGKVRQADYIFTGKIKDLRNGHVHVRVKRAIKGELNATLDLTLNDTCARYIRPSYTGIFMARRETTDSADRRDRIVMHFGPVPLTLANLDRLNAAVRGKSRPSLPPLPSSNGKRERVYAREQIVKVHACI